MTTIIAGTFDTLTRAQAAVNELLGRGCGEEYVSAYDNNAPRQRDFASPHLQRPCGIVVAVNAEQGAPERTVIDVLRDHAARSIEKSDGEWRDGKWVDFDPDSTPRLLHRRYHD